MRHTESERCTTCGREIPAERGIREVYEGTRRAFCSPKCQAEFERDPERYIGETQCLDRSPGYS